MPKAITSEATRAVEDLAAYMGSLRFASSSSSSSSTPDRRVGKIKEQVKQLSETLAWIRAKLNDAEEMEIKAELVRLWLRKLEGVACDAEDVLDEFVYQVLHLRSTENRGVPVRDVTDAVIQSLMVMLLQRTEAINSTFGQITTQWAALQFEQSCGHNRDGRRPPSTSFPEEQSCILGRENDLIAINRFLDDECSDVANNFSVIAIVGMGGLGKTALTQLAYDDDTKRNIFDVKLWIHVSEDFDLLVLARAMVESLTLEPCHLTQLNTLHVILRKKLAGKRFLLVLDDVWEDEGLSSNWDAFTAPLHKGSKGSKIILTTRSEKVSRMIRAASTYTLPFLKEGHCMKLFERCAFGCQNPYLYPRLKAIGEKISAKCKGLPLAVKTLGGLLCGEYDEQVWNNILQYDIQDVREENSIMSILGLSYQHLPPHLKRCFRYCSVFPKGYQFDRDRLVWMWMAHGFIQLEDKKSADDVGKEYLTDLLRRSFFQSSENPEILLMHDLMHDLAMTVSRDECYSVEADKTCSIPGDVRHISIAHCRDPKCISSLEDIYEPRTVRSLIFTFCSFRSILPIKPLDGLITRMEQVRVLDLSYNIDLMDLPSSVGCLKPLRYLGLRSTNVKQLPESIGSLYHLQTLDIKLSGIKSLPDSMSNLVNLNHIVCGHKLEYPVGFGKLINLRTMDGFHISSRLGCAKLGELKTVNNITSLGISGIGNLTDVNEAKTACLEKKEQLRALDLSWESCCSLPIDSDVLESLKPHPKLEWLRISYFVGGSLPSWLEDPSFSNLSNLELMNCQNCTSLPSLGRLPYLRCLSIESVKRVKYIDHEFFCGGFPRLETLQLKYMDSWRSWSGAQRGECPRLQKLHISCCWRLSSLSLVNLVSLQDLKIDGCNELNFSSDAHLQTSQLPCLQNILITYEGYSKHIKGAFSHGEIQSPDTSWLRLEALGHLAAQFAIALGECSNICSLSISSSYLNYLHLEKLSYLQDLGLHKCDHLRSLSWGNGNLSSLERLTISDCAQLQFSNEEHLPSTLRTLVISGCHLLTKWCQYHRQRLAQIGFTAIQDLDKHVVLQNVLSVQEAADAYLGGLQRLHTLELEWGRHVVHGSFRDEKPGKVLENLQPHTNISKLVIKGYIGSRFPHWFEDYSYTNLVYVTLIQFSHCEILPPLGQLPFLMELYIREAHRLRCLGEEFFKGSGSNTGGRQAFPCLRKLEISDMPSWEEWMGIEDSSVLSLGEPMFKNLCELTLENCPVLKAVPFLPASLIKIKLASCNVITLPHSLYHITSLCTLRISQVPALKNLPKLPLGLRKLVLQRLPALTDLEPPSSLRELVLQGCSEEMVTTSLPRLTLITSLQISDLPKLTTIPLHNLGILQKLHISNCPELEKLDCFSFSPASLEQLDGLQALRSLERWTISDCPKLWFSANERPPSSLQSMGITNCPLAQPWHDKHCRMMSIAE